jgi:hypothetical protein
VARPSDTWGFKSLRDITQASVSASERDHARAPVPSILRRGLDDSGAERGGPPGAAAGDSAAAGAVSRRTPLTATGGTVSQAGAAALPLSGEFGWLQFSDFRARRSADGSGDGR